MRVPRLVAVVVIPVLAAFAATGPGASAQSSPASIPPPPEPTGPSTTVGPPVVADAGGESVRLEDARTDPDLASVPVEGREVEAAMARYRDDRRALRDAEATESRTTGELAELAAAEARLVALQNQSTRRLDKSSTRVTELGEQLRRIVLEDYVRGARATPIDLEWNADESMDLRSRKVLLQTVREERVAELRVHQQVVDQMTTVLTQVEAELTEVRARTVSTTATRDQAIGEQARLEAQLVVDAQAAADARLTSTVRGTDFVFVAFDAYYRAAKAVAREQPTCGIRWTLLAGISKTEGNHGTFGGAKLDATGRVDKPIIGIPLDGGNETAVITDSDGGLYDGDLAYDRAVGPMQFIPSTWLRWLADGNLDGRTDPQNIYDGALAAARYLCVYGPGLDTDAGIQGAVIHYNQSQEYVDIVHERARGYDALQLPVRR